MKYALILLLLTSCFGGEEQFLVQRSTKKQRQKILQLEKKLELVAKEKERAESDIAKLAREIDESKLMLIRRQIDDYEKRKGGSPTLFMEEREALYRLIQAGPSPKSLAAQVELDRILQIITELSDEERYVY